MILTDYHIHTSFSGDCSISPEIVIQTAIQKGLTEICITDHQDFGFIADDILFEIDSHKYFESIQSLRIKYKNEISIKTGIEIGLEPDKKDLINPFISSEDFDFVIASSHLINGQDPYYPAYFEGKSDYQSFYEYFKSISDNLDVFTNFDVYGHLDYVVRYCPNRDKNYSYYAFKDIIDEILKKLIELNKGIEINTSSYRLGLNFPNPCIEIIKRFRELGGEIITVGSDSHTPDYLTGNFNLVSEILLQSGYKYYCTFSHRKPNFIKL